MQCLQCMRCPVGHCVGAFPACPGSTSACACCHAPICKSHTQRALVRLPPSHSCVCRLLFQAIAPALTRPSLRSRAPACAHAFARPHPCAPSPSGTLNGTPFGAPRPWASSLSQLLGSAEPTHPTASCASGRRFWPLTDGRGSLSLHTPHGQGGNSRR